MMALSNYRPRHRGLPKENVKAILPVEEKSPLLAALAARPSVFDILARSPGKRLFRSIDAVDNHLRAERDVWEG